MAAAFSSDWASSWIFSFAAELSPVTVSVTSASVPLPALSSAVELALENLYLTRQLAKDTEDDEGRVTYGG